MWSLSVEEEFYLMFPAILLLGWALSQRGRRIPWVTVLVGTAALVSFWFAMAGAWAFGPLGASPAKYLVGFYGAFARAWEFAVGAPREYGLGPVSRQISRGVVDIRGEHGDIQPTKPRQPIGTPAIVWRRTEENADESSPWGAARCDTGIQERLLTFTGKSERTVMLGAILLVSAVSAATAFVLTQYYSVDVLSSLPLPPEDCWLDWGTKIGRHCFGDYGMVLETLR
jgi:hypothetical protein